MKSLKINENPRKSMKIAENAENQKKLGNDNKADIKKMTKMLPHHSAELLDPNNAIRGLV